MVSAELEAPQGEEGHEIADVQGIGGRIEAAIKGEGPFAKALGKRREVGAVGDEAAPLQVFEEGHGRSAQ